MSDCVAETRALSSCMTSLDNASGSRPTTLSSAALWGGLGVLAFSFSLPATRLAVADLSPAVVGLGRALVAAALAAALLAVRREPVPDRADVSRLLLTGVGVVIGFPLFSSLALRELSSAHASVIVGLLPAATAAFAVARGGERPGRGVLGRRGGRARGRARVRGHAGRGRRRGRRPLRARGGRAVRVRLRRGRRAGAPLRRLAGDLLGARADGAGARAGGRRGDRGRRAVARARMPGSASPTWRSSRCSSASSPGTAGSRSAGSRGSARSSSPSRC